MKIHGCALDKIILYIYNVNIRSHLQASVYAVHARNR